MRPLPPLVASCILWFAGLGTAAADVHVVDQNNGPGTEFVAIFAAVNAAAPGDTILIRSGVYVEQVTLTVNQIPPHSHPAKSATGGNAVSPAGNYFSTDPGGNSAGYHTASDGSTLSNTVVGLAGGSQPHQNLQPFLCISFIIALEGIFPLRN